MGGKSVTTPSFLCWRVLGRFRQLIHRKEALGGNIIVPERIRDDRHPATAFARQQVGFLTGISSHGPDKIAKPVGTPDAQLELRLCHRVYSRHHPSRHTRLPDRRRTGMDLPHDACHLPGQLVPQRT